MPDHLDQLARAVGYMERNLDRAFELGPVAREAGMSAFHFSRVFHAVTGEPASEYARKRRLTVAAELLLRSERPVIDIALSAGFESQEAFTRAFRRWYGIPPGRFRRRALPAMLKDTPPLSRDALAALSAGDVSLEPRFESRGESLFIGLACDNTRRSIGIPRLWGRFLRRRGEVVRPVDLATYGIYSYDFSAEEERVDENFPFRYLAGFETLPGACPGSPELPQGMELWRLPPAHYAVFIHRGFLRDLSRTYRYVYKTWFPAQAARFAPAPMFERHPPEYPGDRGDAETELWIPILD